jgi:hypothetical protein
MRRHGLIIKWQNFSKMSELLSEMNEKSLFQTSGIR